VRRLSGSVLFSLALGAIGAVGLVGLAGPAAAQTSPAPGYPPSAPVVVVQPAAAPSTALPRTGSSSTLPFAEAGVGLVLVGGVLTVGMRRRRTAHTLKV
jgi:LPXTG-motif cell wall-anchored protein